MKQLFIFCLLLGILTDGAFAATIYGSIYDLDLNKASNVRVEITTNPKQTFISKEGTYAFEVPTGSYELKAMFYQNNLMISSAAENVTVDKEGSFIVDLILFPSFEAEDEILSQNIESVDNPFEEKNNLFYWILAILLVVVLIGVIYTFNKQNHAKQAETLHESPKAESEVFESQKEQICVVSKDLDGIIKILEEEGGRTTQKDIRKRIPLSEAKISLMITELEAKGIIKRIKKGRGNIIILNK